MHHAGQGVRPGQAAAIAPIQTDTDVRAAIAPRMDGLALTHQDDLEPRWMFDGDLTEIGGGMQNRRHAEEDCRGVDVGATVDVGIRPSRIRPMRFLVLSIALMHGVQAEVAGSVQSQRPLDLPNLWVAAANDALGASAGKNDDDYRSSAFLGQVAVTPHTILAANHSLLTDKTGAQPGRLDELTVTLSWLPWRPVDGWVAVGAGVRVRGDLGGEGMQNRWHDASTLARIDYLEYFEAETPVVGVVTVAGVKSFVLWTTSSLPWLGSGTTALEWGGRGVVAHEGTWQAATDVVVVGRGLDGAIWSGLRYETGGVTDSAPILENVLDHEKGLWVVYGASVGAWFIEAGGNLSDPGVGGKMGFASNRLGPPGSGAVVQSDLTYSPGPALGAEMSWRPQGWSAPWSLTMGIHFGNAGPAWGDNLVEFRQLAVGVLAAKPWWHYQTLALEGYAAAQLGMREDRVAERGSYLPFPEESQITGLAVGRAGVRLAWGNAHTVGSTVRSGVGVGFVGWAPFSRGTVDNGIAREHYAEPVLRPEFSYHVTAQW